MGKRLTIGSEAPDFPIDSPWHGKTSFYEASDGRPAVVVFGRYLGCPICQMQMDDLKQGISALTSRGANVFYVLQSTNETLTSVSRESDWPFEVVTDPEAKIFSAYAVPYGNPLKLVGPGLGQSMRRMKEKGFKHGKYEGHETQLPAAFVVNPDKTIRLAHYAKNIVDMPTPEEIAASLP
ncbi:MAG: peroxiredoxin-like family protein [Coriobacteriales bacterium]